MFRAILNSIVLFILLFINMTLFTWCVVHLELGNKNSLDKTLIRNVQAESSALLTHAPVVTPQSYVAVQPTTTPVQQPLSPLPTLLSTSNQNLVLEFHAVDVQLSKTELARLETILQELSIGHAHSVKILAGPAPSENKNSSPQIAKLRAQNVARIIYPRTQAVKMLYRPTMEAGKVIVEFSKIY